MKDIQNKLRSAASFLRPFEEFIEVKDALLLELGERNQIDSLKADIDRIAGERDALNAELAPIVAQKEEAVLEAIQAIDHAAAIRQEANKDADQVRENAEQAAELRLSDAEQEAKQIAARAAAETQSQIDHNSRLKGEGAALAAELKEGREALDSVLSQVAEAKAKYKELTDLLERI